MVDFDNFQGSFVEVRILIDNTSDWLQLCGGHVQENGYLGLAFMSLIKFFNPVIQSGVDDLSFFMGNINVEGKDNIISTIPCKINFQNLP